MSVTEEKFSKCCVNLSDESRIEVTVADIHDNMLDLTS